MICALPIILKWHRDPEEWQSNKTGPEILAHKLIIAHLGLGYFPAVEHLPSSAKPWCLFQEPQTEENEHITMHLSEREGKNLNPPYFTSLFLMVSRFDFLQKRTFCDKLLNKWSFNNVFVCKSTGEKSMCIH